MYRWRGFAVLPCRATAFAAAVAAALALTGCGGSSGSSATAHSAGSGASTQQSAPTTTGGTPTAVSYDGPTLQNPAPAPDIALRDYLGHHVDLASYRGKAVLLTFIYTHCPDTCPLIVATLHNALDLLGRRASEARVVAVSTDPRGDTRGSVASFLARRQMTGRMEYLVGSRSTLVPVWRAWGISASKPTSQDEVNHTALVYGITASGKVTVIYPANFTAKDVAHDVPLLAAR